VPGRITARVPVSDPAARTALVRTEPVDAAVRLLPGKSARVIFGLRSAEPVLTVPRDALVRRPDGTINVWVAERSGDGWTAAPRRVDLGRSFADRIEIREGLEAGQQVVVRGNETLRAGQSIRFVSTR
jgi:membrane fusion protein, multidrug efflux system